MVSREVFEQQRRRRFGTANPERMRLAHWEWMVRSGVDAYSARSELGVEASARVCCSEDGCSRPDPDWCFSRFGMSRTAMPDGRTICIGGEHEDWYDPDFCIYNDVVVLRAAGAESVTLDSGGVEIYGYPEAVFPPTDFHSASLVGGKIFVIGRLGYGDARTPGTTPVLALDADSYRIDPVATSGPCPGWVYKHHASYDPRAGAVTIRGGKIVLPDAEQPVPRHAAHRLHIGEMRWEVLAEHERHRMFRFEAVRTGSSFREPPAEAFRPRSVSCECLLPVDRGIDVHRLDVQGVLVEFEVIYTEVRVLVEGDLPGTLVDTLLDEVLSNLNHMTGGDWELREVDPNHEW